MKCFSGRCLCDSCFLERLGHILRAIAKHTMFPTKIFLDIFWVLNAARTQMSVPSTPTVCKFLNPSVEVVEMELLWDDKASRGMFASSFPLCHMRTQKTVFPWTRKQHSPILALHWTWCSQIQGLSNKCLSLFMGRAILMTIRAGSHRSSLETQYYKKLRNI